MKKIFFMLPCLLLSGCSLKEEDTRSTIQKQIYKGNVPDEIKAVYYAKGKQIYDELLVEVQKNEVEENMLTHTFAEAYIGFYYLHCYFTLEFTGDITVVIDYNVIIQYEDLTKNHEKTSISYVKTDSEDLTFAYHDMYYLISSNLGYAMDVITNSYNSFVAVSNQIDDLKSRNNASEYCFRFYFNQVNGVNITWSSIASVTVSQESVKYKLQNF